MVAKVPKGNYVLIGGDAGQTGSTLMQEGYHVTLDPLVAKGDIKIVMDQFTPGWKTEPAQANAENALTANNNDIQAFLVSYDGMSLGVLQAIEAANIEPGKILVTGQDMELSAAQAIVEGRQFGSLWPAPDEMAIAGAKAAVAMASARTSARPRPPTMALARSPGSRRRSIWSARSRCRISSASISTG